MNSADMSTRESLLRYRSVDLLTAVMIGVAFGVVFWGWDRLYVSVSSLSAFIAYPPSSGVLGGVWLMAAVVGGLVVRRPGAALLAELVAATVEYLLPGSGPWGFSILVSGALQGLGMEIALALWAYRRSGPIVALVGGALSAAAEVVYEWWVYYTDWSWTYKFAYLGFFAVSGALVAGLGGWALVRALRAAGALDAFDTVVVDRDGL
jgi:energy-coupling factor transport system permease protein